MFRDVCLLLSTAMARKGAQLITSMISITRWNMRQTFSSLGLYISVSEALEVAVKSEVTHWFDDTLQYITCYMTCDVKVTYMKDTCSHSCWFFTSTGIQIQLAMRLNLSCRWRSLELSAVLSTSLSRWESRGTHLIYDAKLILLGNNLDNFFLCCLSDPEPWVLSSEGSTAEHWDPRNDKKWESAPANIWLSYRPGGCEAWPSDLKAE